MQATIQVTPKKLKSIVRGLVRDELREFLADPDLGLPIRESFSRKIQRSKRAQAKGEVITAEMLIRRLKLRV